MRESPETFDANRVHDALRDVRDLVNVRRRHAALMADIPRYHTICSAMDTVGDTTGALQAYQGEQKQRERGTGHAYLLAYGVLQALYLQQDAVFWLCKLLEVKPVSTSKDPGAWTRGVAPLDAARTARNNSIGHPVRRDRSGPLASFFMSQSTVDREGFQMFQHNADGSVEWGYVDLTALVNEQLRQVEATLTEAARQLREADAAHHRKFMAEKLTDIFTELNYPVEKLGADGQYGRESNRVFAVHVRDGLTKFRTRLTSREEPFGPDLEWSFAKLDRALRVLEEYGDGSTAVDGPLADVAAGFVRYALEDLRKYASEIDTQYASDDRSGSGC